MTRLIALFLVMILLFSCATAPDHGGSSPDEAEAVPYGKEEFSPALVKLRRAEILFFGALPLFYMFSNMGYDLVGIEPRDSETELAQKMTLSVSLSALLSLADFILGEREAVE